MADACCSAQLTSSALPANSTSTTGLPTATTASSSCCCRPVSCKSSLSPAASELLASPCSPSICALRPSTSSVTSARLASKTASVKLPCGAHVVRSVPCSLQPSA